MQEPRLRACLQPALWIFSEHWWKEIAAKASDIVFFNQGVCLGGLPFSSVLLVFTDDKKGPTRVIVWEGEN